MTRLLATAAASIVAAAVLPALCATQSHNIPADMLALVIIIFGLPCGFMAGLETYEAFSR